MTAVMSHPCERKSGHSSLLAQTSCGSTSSGSPSSGSTSRTTTSSLPQAKLHKRRRLDGDEATVTNKGAHFHNEPRQLKA